MTHMARTAILWTILALIAVSPALAADKKPLLPAAAPIIGVRGGEGTSYATPQVGPAAECDGIVRQFVLMNPDIVAGEPVLLRLLLRSTTPETRREFQARMAFGTDVRVYVFPPEGQSPYEYLGLEQGSVVPNGILEMAGFEFFRFDFRIAVDKNTITGAAFEVPGQYKLRVELACIEAGKQMGTLDMGTFTLTVKEPQGQDAVALDILSEDFTVFEYIQLRTPSYPGGRDPMDANQLRLLERVLKDAPDSAVAPHVRIVMADYYMRQDDFDQAQQMLNTVQEEWSNTPLYDEALFTELRMGYVMQDQEKALATFNRVWGDPIATQVVFPKSPHWSTFVAPHLKEDVGTQWMIQEKPGPDPTAIGGQGGPTIQLDPEVQQMFGLPPELSAEEFNRALQFPVRAQDEGSE